MPSGAHRAARTVGLDDAAVTLARQGASTDSRETALIAVALRVLAEPSTLNDDDVTEFCACGCSGRIMFELVGLVTLKPAETGAFNHSSASPQQAPKANLEPRFGAVG